MSDGDLVRQALDGRSKAYEELVRRWAAPVLALCHAKVRCGDAAEDLAQETLLRGFRALGTLSDPDKFGAWLRGIASRVCLDWIKSQRTRQVTFGVLFADGQPEDLLISDGRSLDQILDREDQLRRLMREVEGLPADYREAIMLYYYQDVTYRDLAETLGVSAATINARLTKARAMLRERMLAPPRTDDGLRASSQFD